MNAKNEIRKQKENGQTRYGFFAEFLLKKTLDDLGIENEVTHYNSTDFLIEGKSFDAKASVIFDKKLDKTDPDLSKQKVAAGVEKINTIFYMDDDFVTHLYDNKEILKVWTWDELDELYVEWNSKKCKKVNTHYTKKHRKLRKGEYSILYPICFRFLVDNGITTYEVYAERKMDILPKLKEKMEKEHDWCLSVENFDWYIEVGMLKRTPPKKNSGRNIMERSTARDFGFITIEECAKSIEDSGKNN